MRLLRRLFRTLAAVAFWCIGLSIGWVLIMAVLPPPVTSTMLVQRFEQGRADRSWRALEAMARTLPNAVIAAEDQKFMFHHGFDIEAIGKALEQNERRKGRGRVKGASTISQQVAKNVFLWQGRTWVRKGLEVWFTALVELLWSKERILEVYLNVAELGPGTFGAEAAAQRCFGKSASRLGALEAALLAAVLPAPRRYSCQRPGGFVRSRQQWIARQMDNLGDQLDPVVLARAREEMELEDEREQRRKERRRQRKRT
ncbi:MAG TPA: monofunctional biosynthetic peptidoglycan transglycosylase [Flavobacteriales bacterium]|nr:monofunctional biosynthetic peptidoglycan transglycosylase [Flavobacteriales bacterium]HQW87222.1 monofunctional biosynthetic peptidoglycan transglycosylase [Flavobacteriales bacterium]